MLCVRIVAEGVLMIRTYKDLQRLNTFEERFEYLKLGNIIGEETFGYDRYLNQLFYKSDRWKKTRDNIIIRDNGCDLGLEEYPIYNRIIVHHMNPITLEDLERDAAKLYNPNFLICVSHNTHNAITYSDVSLLPKPLIERRRHDTCPWKD